MERERTDDSAMKASSLLPVEADMRASTVAARRVRPRGQLLKRGLGVLAALTCAGIGAWQLSAPAVSPPATAATAASATEQLAGFWQCALQSGSQALDEQSVARRLERNTVVYGERLGERLASCGGHLDALRSASGTLPETVAQLDSHWRAYHDSVQDTDYLVLASGPSPLAAVLAQDWARLQRMN